MESEWFLRAFGVLAQARPVGMAPGAIPLSEIVCYWRHIGSIGPIDEFVRIIQACDREWMAHWREKNPAKSR